MTSGLRRSALADIARFPEDFSELYRGAGYWTGETFAEFMPTRAAHFGDRVAVVGPDATGARRQLTYRDLDESAARIATGLLNAGVRAGDRVVLQLPNIVEYTEVLFAVFRIGALPVFALPAHRASEVGYFCRFADAAAYIVAAEHGGFDYRTLAREVTGALENPPAVIVAGDSAEFTSLASLRTHEPAPIADVDAESVAFLQLSGGTTGTPKLIPRTHADYLYSVRDSARICGVDERTRMLVVLPAAHNFPMSSPGILGVLHAGGTVVLAPDPSPDTAFALIESERVTMASLVPPLALAWLCRTSPYRHDLSSLEVLQVGGAKFRGGGSQAGAPGTRLHTAAGLRHGRGPRQLHPPRRRRRDDHPDPGTSDQPARRDPCRRRRRRACRRRRPRTPAHPGSVHDPRLLQCARAQFDGVHRRRVLPHRRHRAHHRHGYIVVEGRAKDQINRGGEKIAAEEVENHLLAHPAVLDAAVVAMPDQYLGERTCAFVVTEGEAPKALALKAFLRERGLAAYKIPDKVRFVDAFPVTGVGKISRNELRRALAATLQN